MHDNTAATAALDTLSRQSPPDHTLLESLLCSDDPVDVRTLCDYADAVRHRQVGDGVLLRGIIEFSSYCSRTCWYCGLRAGNTALPRYRLTDAEIMAAAGQIAACGMRTVVLQSGEDPDTDPHRIADLVRRITTSYRLAVTLSVGERPRDDYALWKDAGADRYLLKIETANPALYASLHPGMTFENRVRCLRDLRELGYQVGSGSIVGLPGQTCATLADDLCFFAAMDFDMIGVSPFIPHLGTPGAGAPNGDLALTLKMLALTRIVTRNAHLPATTALGSIDGTDHRQDGLRAGANVVMPNFTPQPYRQQYEIYPGKRCITEQPGAGIPCLQQTVVPAGRFLDFGRGDSLKR
jgi:biotin synthase